MKHASIFLFSILFVAVLTAPADAQWKCLYATFDDALNGTGHNAMDVGVIEADKFVAVVWTPSTTDPRGARNFFVPYVLADSASGRIWNPGYGGATAGKYQKWSDGGTDEVEFSSLTNIRATSDGVVYGANNDAAHNILVFKFETDTVAAYSPFYRMETGANGISAVTVDGNGYVYVVNDTTAGKTDDIKIYPPLAQWSSHQLAPTRTVDLPDGIYKGIATNPDGTMIFVSDFTNRSILKYTGSPAGGYTLDNGFSMALADGDTVAGRTTKPTFLRMAFKSPENILFAACDLWLTQAYEWGRIYLINPWTGDLASADSATSIINVAKWNFDQTGAYNDRVGGTASGYTSTWDVEFDADGNVYSQSHYGWTIEKWMFDGTLPTLAASSVEPVIGAGPRSFSLSANYPNPFNPTTKISFSIDRTTDVRLEVTDVLGRVVAVLAQGRYEAGTYNAHFNADGLSSGVYLARLSSPDGVRVQRMLLAR